MEHFISPNSEHPYRVHVEMPDNSVKTFIYSGPENTWLMAGEKMKLAEEFGVDPDSVIVMHRDHGVIL